MDRPMPLPLELVLNVMACMLPKPNVILSPSHPITQTLFSFTLVCHETRPSANRFLQQHCVYLSSASRLRSFLLAIPNRPDLCNITCLFLAPFGITIDDQPTALWTKELFSYTCRTLKRVIIDMPLRSLYPEDDHLAVRNILREGFERLEHIEEFVSIRDELFLDTTHHGAEPPVWKQWRKLKRLALYNVDADSDFWRDIASMPNLETIVLTRADSLREYNMKSEYFRHTARPLKVLIINVEEHQVRFGNMRRANWDAVDADKKMTIMTYNVPSPFEDDNPIVICQEYVREGAERRTLWNWEGEIIQHLPRIIQQVSSGA